MRQRFVIGILAVSMIGNHQVDAYRQPLRTISRCSVVLSQRQLDHRWCFQTAYTGSVPGQKLFVSTSRNEDRDSVVEEEEKQQPKGLAALWAKYGPLYFIVWFTIYLPFLCTFFYAIDNDIMSTSQYGIDPPSALNSLIDTFERVTNNHDLLSHLRGSKHVANFAAAYLCADLVPTTVFALAAVGYITTRNGTQTDDVVNKTL